MRIFRSPGVGIAVGVFIVAGVIAAVRARGPVVATAIASRTDLEQHVIASGRVRVVTRVQLSAQIAGRVMSVRAVERNLAWIRFGQQARASADAYPRAIFDAAVDYIAPAIDRQRGSIEVRLRVPEPPDFLKPNMTVSVDARSRTSR